MHIYEESEEGKYECVKVMEMFTYDVASRKCKQRFHLHGSKYFLLSLVRVVLISEC